MLFCAEVDKMVGMLFVDAIVCFQSWPYSPGALGLLLVGEGLGSLREKAGHWNEVEWTMIRAGISGDAPTSWQTSPTNNAYK